MYKFDSDLSIMTVHVTDYLEVFYDIPNSLFIQNWKKSPENTRVFKTEMLNFVKKYVEYKPSKALWLHENFALQLDQEAKLWAERFVVEPCIKAGNRKLAFIVSKDVLSHLSVLESFEGINMNHPKHFSSKKEALKWLIEGVSIKDIEPKDPNIYFDGVDKDGNMLLKVKSPSEATGVLKFLKKIRDRHEFYEEKYLNFRMLTGREKEVLYKYAQGVSLNEISDEFCISIYTVRTHWRNIKRKLRIQSPIEAANYKSFYL